MAQQEEMNQHGAMLKEILQQIQVLSSALSPAPVVPPQLPAPPTEPCLPNPQRFEGNAEECRGFLCQCCLTFALQPKSFPTEASRVSYVITLLTGRALAWATALYDRTPQDTSCSTFNAFAEEMLRVFTPSTSRSAATKLLQLHQGGQGAADYTIRFRTLAAESGWGQESLFAIYYNGLSDRIKDELVSWEEINDLETLIARVIRLDNRLLERSLVKGSKCPCLQSPLDLPAATEETDPEPIQLGGTRLSPKEHDRCMRERCCLYCGKPGHFRSSCPELAGKAQPHPAGGQL